MNDLPNGNKPQDGNNLPEKADPPSTQAPKVEIVPPAISSALRASGLNPEDPNVTKIVQISSAFLVARGSLPIPPAPLLAEYDEEFPGLAERMIGWFEDQRKHRQSLEEKRTDRSESRMDRGQLFTFIGMCLCVGGAVVVGLFGNAYVAAVLAIVGIGGPTAATLMAGNSPFSLRRPSPPSSPTPPGQEEARQTRQS